MLWRALGLLLATQVTGAATDADPDSSPKRRCSLVEAITVGRGIGYEEPEEGRDAIDGDINGYDDSSGSGESGFGDPVSDWHDLVLTTKALGSRLSHPTRRDFVSYAVLAIGAAQLQNRKFDIAGEFRQKRNGRANRFSSAVRPLGESVVPAVALSTYLIGRLAGSQSVRSAGLILSESALFTFAATEVGQYVLAEKRPYQGGQMRFFAPGGHGVSGHTSILASMVAPLDRMYLRFSPSDSGWRRTFKVLGKGLLYGAPAVVGWSRMNDDLHFAWNVFLGYGTGYLVGSFVADAHGLDWKERTDRPWSLVPITGDRGAPGLAFKWSR